MTVIANYSGDVVVFRSAEEAERYIEPQDVRSGACTVYDEQGCRLRPVVVRNMLAERVKLAPFAGMECQADQLRDVLIMFVSHFADEIGGRAVREATLQELIERAADPARKGA